MPKLNYFHIFLPRFNWTHRRPGAQKGGVRCVGGGSTHDAYFLLVNVRNMSRWNEQLCGNSSRWWVCFDSGGFEANSIVLRIAVSCTIHVNPFPAVLSARARVLVEWCFSWRNFKQQCSDVRENIFERRSHNLETPPPLNKPLSDNVGAWCIGGSGYYYMAKGMKTVCWKPSALS